MIEGFMIVVVVFFLQIVVSGSVAPFFALELLKVVVCEASDDVLQNFRWSSTYTYTHKSAGIVEGSLVVVIA